MRGFAFVLAASLALAGAAQATPPSRVASLNLCTDELLLMLADPGQIVSVTHLAQRQAETPYWRSALRYPKNDGSLLSVAPMKPDLVLSMGGGSRDRTRIAERLGVKSLDLPYPMDLFGLEANVMKVAIALGREDRGLRIVGAIRELKRSAPAGGADTIWLGGGGRSVASAGLAAEWMQLAGLAQRPLTGDRVSLEQLLAAPPAILLRSDYRSGQYSSEQRWLSHPLAQGATWSRVIRTDGRRWTCMGPAMVSEVKRLREAAR